MEVIGQTLVFVGVMMTLFGFLGIYGGALALGCIPDNHNPWVSVNKALTVSVILFFVGIPVLLIGWGLQ